MRVLRRLRAFERALAVSRRTDEVTTRKADPCANGAAHRFLVVGRVRFRLHDERVSKLESLVPASLARANRRQRGAPPPPIRISAEAFHALHQLLVRPHRFSEPAELELGLAQIVRECMHPRELAGGSRELDRLFEIVDSFGVAQRRS